jgi:hypothetical protein
MAPTIPTVWNTAIGSEVSAPRVTKMETQFDDNLGLFKQNGG